MNTERSDRKTELYNTREPAVPPRRKSPPTPTPTPVPPAEGIIGDYEPAEEDMFWAKH